ncbi:hypothetical protein ILUMI_16440 [Ignelater luminosus]|uniref:Zinc finger PHD-type domain-containing protein n=1 Tax=Ignelater luminosus TaxID=2038154 RepID=A0A8K0CLT3_IGNLU|nr:hypothetical protein ILUMI_16440 [Ignelater luminosus]
MQSLDRMVFGPLKRYFNSSADGWLKSNPGRTMNIYDIPLILKPLSLTPKNVQKGFSVTRIWPYNREVFEDDEYFPSERLPERLRVFVDEKSAILTDTPIKSALEQETRLRDSKRKKVSSTKKILVANSTNKQRKIAIKKIRKSESEESEDEDTLCIICLGSFSKTRKTDWIQCTNCKKWAHISCGKDDDFYMSIR